MRKRQEPSPGTRPAAPCILVLQAVHVGFAQRAAQTAGNPEITPAHIALAATEVPETTVPETGTTGTTELGVPVPDGPEDPTGANGGTKALLQHATGVHLNGALPG